MSILDWKTYELTVHRVLTNVKGPKIESPIQLNSYFESMAKDELQESLFLISFNGRNDIIGITRVYSGTATGTSIAINEVLRPAILTGAVGIALVHNHPSGDSEPSDADKNLTKEIVNACRIMDLEFLDHMVMGADSYTSIRSQYPGIWEDSKRQEEF